VKNLATWFARKTAAREVNVLLAQEIADRNAVAAKPVVLLDETRLAARYGDLALSRKFYDSESVHPTELALRLSEIYGDIVFAVKLLLGRKVIVLDLDNTLWHGVIGEGAVENDHRRQKVLKLLRHKGILLAIASKNDPKNVHWTGATLNEKDFVAVQINWDPKPVSIKRIAEDLNLKLKDFVFIDDRPDEREMVGMSIPGILCLDATEEKTWKTLDWWAEALPEQNEGDRTQMYLERKARQSHLDEAAEKEDQQKLLASLGIRIDLYPAKQKDLARAAELINRTNQFNTCGSRVSNQQVAAWSDSSRHFILVAEASDKFGAMGIISVMVVEQVEDALLVPIWVLSCRVFGFGIESAMLRYVADLAQKLGVGLVRGMIVETPNNQPCREVYASNGFTATDSGWELTSATRPEVPAWLAVTSADVPPVLQR
jgi:FkbH-like protein